MKLRTAGAAALAAALLLLAQAPPRPDASAQQQNAKTRQDSIVFVVAKDAAQRTQVEPVAVINSRGALADLPTADQDGAAPNAFLASRYRAGTKYHLIYGGADAGTLTIRAATPAECSPNAASVDVDSAAKLGGNVMALATDGAHAPRAQVSRRAPTDVERAAALGLLKRFLASKRVGAATVQRNTKTLNLTATDLDGDGREELVGSYVVKTGPKMRDTLFLIAAPQGQSFRPVLTEYARVKSSDLPDPSVIDNIGEGGLGAELYIDQLDADGDGVGEVFTLSGSFEGTHYKVYRRQRGAWRAAYEGYSYRCAY